MIGFKNEEYLIVSFLVEKYCLYGCKVLVLLLVWFLSGLYDYLKGNLILIFKFLVVVRIDLIVFML